MPKVPEYDHKPLRTLFNAKDDTKPVTVKQKSLIDTLCRRHKIPQPDYAKMNMGQATKLIDSILNPR